MATVLAAIVPRRVPLTASAEALGLRPRTSREAAIDAWQVEVDLSRRGRPVSRYPSGGASREGRQPLLAASLAPAMAPPKESSPALAAPGVGGLLATPGQGLTGPRKNRRRRNRPYRHVHVEIDLAGPPKPPGGVPALEQLEGILRERKIVERGSLVRLAAGTLHALASKQFRRVDHWEVTPGGWLPLPTGPRSASGAEPVGALLDALESGRWASVTSARSFAARLAADSGARIDVTVRRVHREWRHAMTLDLSGVLTRDEVRAIIDALAARLPVVRSTLTKYQFA